MPLIHKVYRLLDAFSTRFCISNVISHCMLLGNNRASLPLFCRCSSEVTPSILHRYSIVSPSFRWTNDGVTMEEPRRKSDVTALDLPSFKGIEKKKVRFLPLCAET